MAGVDIGIDLGTSSVVIFASDRGIVLNEPSAIATDDRIEGIVAVGKEAKAMIGKTHDHLKVVRPLRNGVITDYYATEMMLKRFVEAVTEKKGMGRVIMPRIMVCVPSGITPVERKAVEEATKQAGAREVFLIEEPIAAAIGAGLDIGHPEGNMVVDIGGGTTDIAVISLGGSVVSQSIKIAGNSFDQAIIKYVKNEHNLLIGDITAERIKKEIGCAYPRREVKFSRAAGRDLGTGLPRLVEISSDEVMKAIEECVRQIIAAIITTLETTPPELASDVSERGIVLTGGGALIYGLDKRIEDATMINTIVAEEPLNCVARGTGMALGFLDVLDKGRAFTRGE